MLEYVNAFFNIFLLKEKILEGYLSLHAPISQSESIPKPLPTKSHSCKMVGLHPPNILVVSAKSASGHLVHCVPIETLLQDIVQYVEISLGKAPVWSEGSIILGGSLY